jgi:PadR family transcriptional regulator, regulatory protein PadR
MARVYLGEFEHLVLLAILRLGGDAYAPAIMTELERKTGRVPSPGSIYVTLDRLETKGLVRSRLADASTERGGRPRRYLTVSALGLRELRAFRSALLQLWLGVEHVLDG